MIATVLLFSLWAWAGILRARATEHEPDLIAQDYSKTEEIINEILTETPGGNTPDMKKAGQPDDSAAEKRKGGATNDSATAEKKAAPASTSGPEKKNSTSGEKSSPTVTSEEAVLLKTGIDFFNSGLYEHSLKKFQELVTKYPQGTFKDSARFWLGKIQLRLYRYDDAIKEFSAVSPDSGDYPASIYYSGESCQMKGDQISSIEYYQRVYAQFPVHELADKALLNIGRLYMNQKKGPQALDSAVKLVKNYKDRDTVDDAYYLMGNIYEKDPLLKDIEIARKIYRQFIKNGSTDDRFGKSPLKKRVQEDLARIEKMYFKMEQ
ncbi:MAG: hypothetical protein A2176_05420 [Spirochaetes bacterium RBG_13_51_14]|nr:MAG: hypothetical protein A2176_05420 [Spirochaetes bacterium RBG_13_51_14]